MSLEHKIAIITNVLPQYREDMYNRLFSKYGDRIQVFCQNEIPGMNLNSIHEKYPDNVTLINYLSLKKEKLCWQFVPFLHVIKNYQIIFIYGNPRVISNVIYSFLCKLLGKKVVIWGQFHTASSNSLLKKIRIKWWSFFDYVFLYTDKEAEEYKRINKPVFVTGMNNGVNQDEIFKASQEYAGEALKQWKSDQGVLNKRIVLSCARLEHKNKFDLVIDCIPTLVVNYPDLLWCVIGDGDVRVSLQNKADAMGVSDHIKWVGAVYGQQALAPWFMSSEFMVHPGAIGLSLMHAMGYALPVITHNNNEKQMPEIVALENGVNGLTYIEGNTESLCDSILQLLNDKNMQAKLSSNALKTVAENYNTEIMAEKFITMINKIKEDM